MTRWGVAITWLSAQFDLKLLIHCDGVLLCFHYMVSHGQNTAWGTPSLSRSNTWPLSSLWKPSTHLALFFELWRYPPSDAMLTPAISPITGRLVEGGRTCPLCQCDGVELSFQICLQCVGQPLVSVFCVQLSTSTGSSLFQPRADSRAANHYTAGMIYYPRVDCSSVWHYYAHDEIIMPKNENK